MRLLKVIYKDDKIRKICEDLIAAKKFLGGNKIMATSLLARINALKQADTIIDIILQLQFFFHKLKNKGKNKNLEGYFAIDVKTRRDKWRIILEPLDTDEKPFNHCDIDLIAKKVRIVKIEEVSNHYE